MKTIPKRLVQNTVSRILAIEEVVINDCFDFYMFLENNFFLYLKLLFDGHILWFNCFWKAPNRRISNGLDKSSPHCSFIGKCDYDDDSKKECAEALCLHQGFSGGVFVEASNNFCTRRIPGATGKDLIWVYYLKMSTGPRKRDRKGGELHQRHDWLDAAKITADCY